MRKEGFKVRKFGSFDRESQRESSLLTSVKLWEVIILDRINRNCVMIRHKQ